MDEAAAPGAANAILPVCEQSGLVLKRQRKTSFPLITVSGTVSIEAIRGYSSATESWHCPVREQWGLAKWARLSPELEQRLAYNAAVTGSYEKAAKHAKRWGSAISDDAIHALVRRVAERNQGVALRPRLQFQDRLKHRGQFLSPSGLAHMLDIDLAVKNDTLQFLWNSFCTHRPCAQGNLNRKLELDFAWCGIYKRLNQSFGWKDVPLGTFAKNTRPAAPLMNSPDELRPDTELRRLVLQELYRHNESHHWLVKPEAFNPPMERRVVMRIGMMLKNMELLRSIPGQVDEGCLMQLSVKGKLYCEKGLADAEE